MSTARTRTLKAILKHPGSGALLVNHRVSIMLFTGVTGFVEDGTVSGEKTTAILAKRYAWTDPTGLLAVPGMEVNVDIAPPGTGYSIQLLERTTPLTFTLQPDNVTNDSDAWLFDNLTGLTSPPSPGGVTEAEFDAFVSGLPGTYVRLPIAAPTAIGQVLVVADIGPPVVLVWGSGSAPSTPYPSASKFPSTSLFPKAA